MSMDYFFMSKEEETAQDNPMLVMVDEQTGDRYARMTGAKGVGENQERDWLIKDMSEELKDWGHTGGEGGHIILKCDGEKPIKKVRDRLGKISWRKGSTRKSGKGGKPIEWCSGTGGKVG